MTATPTASVQPARMSRFLCGVLTTAATRKPKTPLNRGCRQRLCAAEPSSSSVVTSAAIASPSVIRNARNPKKTGATAESAVIHGLYPTCKLKGRMSALMAIKCSDQMHATPNETAAPAEIVMRTARRVCFVASSTNCTVA
eukprot:Amastigsp_a340052_137.p3 type:complete len:141 gc:universal Amastigsp_a340052_137:1106-1528(+)